MSRRGRHLRRTACLVAAASVVLGIAPDASYGFVDLGQNTAAAVNDSGQVAINPLPGPQGGGARNAFVWDQGKTEPLLGFAGGNSYANDISPSGRVVGYATDMTSSQEAAFWQGSGTAQPIGPFPDIPAGASHSSQALAVNGLGDVTGSYTYMRADSCFTCGSTTRAFLASGGSGPVVVGRGDAPSTADDQNGKSWDTTGTGIDNEGNVLGALTYKYRPASGSEPGVYLWAKPDGPGQRLPLAPNAGLLMAYDGEIVGGSPPPPGFYSGSGDYLLRRRDGSSVDLGAGYLPTAVENGRVVGAHAVDGTSHAALWQDGRWQDLAPLLPGWTSTQPTDVSPNGNIVGIGTLNGVQHSFLLRAASMTVKLDAFTPAGEKLDGQVASGDVVLVRLSMTNDSDRDLHDLQLADGVPLNIDSRGTGELRLLAGPTPAFDASTLRAHETRQYVFVMSAIAAGRAAAETRVSVDDPVLGHLEGARSLRFDIADKTTKTAFDPALTKFLAIQAVDRSLVRSFQSYHDGLTAYADKLAGKLRRRFSAKDRRRWFGGDGSKLLVGPLDYARARQEASAGAAMAAQLPKRDFHGFTAEELQAEYNRTFKEEAGKGVSKWARGWKNLGSAAKKGLQDSWSEALMSARWAFGTATPEERLQIEAMASTFAGGVGSDTRNLYNVARREVPRTFDNAGYLLEASGESVKQVVTFPSRVINAYARQQDDLLPLAESDPLKYQRESAKLAADALNQGLPVIFDTLIGGAVSKVASAGKAYVIAGKGASIIETGEAAGVLRQDGRVVRGFNTSISLSDSSLPHGLAAEETAALQREGAFLKQRPGATVVQATDFGKVYKLPNLGGVPEVTLDAKAQILGDIEKAYVQKTGKPLKLAEVLKPGTPLAKEGGVAKTELTSANTGKSEMVDAGMPDAALAEASVWRNPVSPAESNADFASWAKPRQEAAIEAWKKGNDGFREYLHPTDPTSKIARLKECIGKLGRVPLDLEPIGSGPDRGLQRFVEAEYQEIIVKQGTGEARLLRVKKYAVEVVDTRTGKVVNRRVVVDSNRALPQTPDADAVAVGKVVGVDGAGKPILAPLSRAEREFVMQRYVAKNVQARRLGLTPDLAEHGTTLVMDDAGAKAAGFLLPKYGVPFLPDAVGRAYLARIAKFVAPAGVTPEQMLAKMLDVVQGSGGFGQHTVVVTSDSRFLGEVPFASW